MKKFDCHVHVSKDLPPEESAAYLSDMCRRHSLDGINLLAWSLTFPEKCNESCLALSKMLPNAHAFCGLTPDKDYAAQAEALMGMGFEGIKLLRGGKPSCYKDYGHLYDDEIYESFFALCEERQYPILMHNNDPAFYWDRSRATEKMIARGWIYDESVPSHARYYEAVETVLSRHPHLKLALAHLGFYSEDLDRAFALMETYPNLYMDATPALNIYEDLSSDRERAERFFRTYHQRIFLGTDAVNHLVGYDREKNDKKHEILPYFFGGGKPREMYGLKISPIHLKHEMLENIYYNTAMRFLSKEER